MSETPAALCAVQLSPGYIAYRRDRLPPDYGVFAAGSASAGLLHLRR